MGAVGPIFTYITLFCLVATVTAAPFDYGDYRGREETWFASDSGRRIADRLLTWQSEAGGWPKNQPMHERPIELEADLRPTFDNHATVDPMRYLAEAWRATGDARYRDAFLRGLDYILEAQYANGGWPQFYPLIGGYHDAITFNDGAMIGVMRLLDEVTANRDGRFDFVDTPARLRVAAALERGLHCILQTQVRVDGVPTVWCAQHDPISLAPVKARAYEHASLSGGESAGIVEFLMDIPDPSSEVRAAVDAAMAWFKQTQITGYGWERTKTDQVLIADPSAGPLWARFYEIGGNRPIFSGRDGVIHYELGRIDQERRAGYSWYSTAPQRLFERHAQWRAGLQHKSS